MQKTKKLGEKIIAGLIAFIMVFSNFATLGTTLISFAAEEDITYSAQFVWLEPQQPEEPNNENNVSENGEEQNEDNVSEGNEEQTSENVGENQQEVEGTEETSQDEQQQTEETEQEPETAEEVEQQPEQQEENNENTEDLLNNSYAIEITLGVKEKGYLKNSKIEIKDLENQIFKLRENVSLGEYIQSIEENKIRIKQINSGIEIKIYIPIELKDEESIDMNKLQNGVDIELLATYVDNDGNEEILTKSQKPVFDVRNDINLLVDSNVEKCIPYVKDGVNEALVQLKVDAYAEGTQTLPIKDTEIQVDIPQIDGTTVNNVSVSAINTAYTNGLSGTDSIFTVENWKYQDGKVIISVDNVEKDGKYLMSNGKDEYIINYTYSNFNDSSNNLLHATVSARSNIFTGTGTAEINNSVDKEYNLSEANSNIVTYQVTRQNQEMSKGYLYANTNSNEPEYELEFENSLNTNISRTDLVKSIEIREANEYFVDAEGNVYSNSISNENSSYYRYVKLNKENLNSIIGENGNFEILLEDGTSLIALTKDTEDDGDGYITITFGDNRINRIIFKINNPEGEGILNISWVKVVDKTAYGKLELSSFKALKSDYVGKATLTENLTSDLGTKTVSTELIDTTTNATVSLSRNELSTLVRNDDVQINISLNNANSMSDMYKNPVFELTFPEEVQNVEITDINLLYGDEQLETSNIETLRNSNNQVVVRISLQGAQRKYSLGDQERGTTIILNTNITLDMYRASKSASLVMNYYNEDATNYAIGSDWNMMAEPSSSMINPREGTFDTSIEVVAPEGFVNAQMITGYKEDNDSVISVNQGVKEAKIATFTDSKVAEMKMILINNTDEEMNNVHILGRTMFEGNKSIIDEEDLGTNKTAPMISEIAYDSSFKTTVYYSENGEATDDLNNPANGWTENPTDIRMVKSYLLVMDETLKIGDMLLFSYNFEIPEGLSNNVNLAGTFGTYYTGTKTVGIGEPDKVVLTTGDAPELNVETFTNVDTESVVEGQHIEYTVRISNVGRTVAENIVVNSTIPEGTTYVENGELKPDTKELHIKVDKIEPGKTEEVTYEVEVNDLGSNPDGIESDNNVDADGLEKPIESNEENLPVEQAKLKIKLMDSIGNKAVQEGFKTELITYVENLTDKDMTNCEITQKIPEGMEVVEVKGNGSYDENNRTVTWHIDKIQESKKFIVKIRIGDVGEDGNLLSSTSTITADELDKTYTSNEYVYTFLKPQLEYEYYTNKDNRYVQEGDKIKYTLKITNNGKGDAYGLSVENNIPDEYRVTSVVCKTPDKEYNALSANKVLANVDVKSGETVEIDVECYVSGLSGNMQEKFTSNNWTISGANIDTVESPKIENIVKAKAGQDNAGASSNSGNNEYTVNRLGQQKVEEVKNQVQLNQKEIGSNNETEQISQNYRVIGVAFEDTNKNGQRDENENRMSNIAVKLCDPETQNIICQTTTNAAGEYFLENVPNGEYYIKFEYDTQKYRLTEYKKQGVTADKNSDAITSNYKAVTDKIIVDGNSVSDMDIGLISAGIFDLSLDANINKVTVQDNKETKTYEMENPKLAKVDINPKNVSSSKVIIEYTLTIANKGEIAGYVKRLVDYIPPELDLDTSLSPNWYLGADGYVYNQELENDLINPGETRTVTLILTKQMTEDSNGIFNNTFEIAQSYNEYAIADIDSTEGNRAESEDDMSRADIIIGIQTGGSMINIMIISTTLITLLIALYVVKIYVDKKNKEVIV